VSVSRLPGIDSTSRRRVASPSDSALFDTVPLFLNLNNMGKSRRFLAAEQAGRHLFPTCYAPVIDLLFENR
jgi:hypothetical protein